MLEISQRAAKADWEKGSVYLLATNPFEEVRTGVVAREPGTIKWLEDNLQWDDSFYDIGASTGGYSLVAAKIMQSLPAGEGMHGTVCAFEPFANNFAALTTNVMLNVCSEWVFAFPVFLSDLHRIAHIDVHQPLGGVSKHRVVSAPTEQSHPVLTIGGDTVRSMYQMPRPELIRINAHDQVLPILKGMKLTMKDSNIRSVMIAVDESEDVSNKIEAFMRQAGFELRTRHPMSGDENGWEFHRVKDVNQPESKTPEYVTRDGYALEAR